MPDGNEPVAVKVLRSLKDVPEDAWNACAGDRDPFVRHGFLSALEDSGSAVPETGWMAQHLAIEDGDGTLVACAPLYLKNHSHGEYVFDWGWADAYERAGGRYYPKLQCAVPFTPVTGRRLLIRPDVGPDRAAQLEDVLTAAMVQVAQQLEISSVHITFPTEAEWRRLGDNGLLKRIGEQFHWHNDGYATFDDFLARLSSRKRKNIKKERRSVADSGLEIRTLTGAEIEDRHWDAFYDFYLDTTDRKWGPSYLKKAFFPLMAERLGDAVVLILVEKAGEPVAGALNLRGRDTLYGRNWGCIEDYRFLHFEACYYQAIDYAIREGLDWVEAGAQGPHKVQRGYLPRLTYSAHWVADSNLKRAVAHFLDQEGAQVKREMAMLSEMSPYRRDGA